MMPSLFLFDLLFGVIYIYKTQNQLRSAVANLPTDIQVRILGSKAMTESCDLWFKHFKILDTTHFPVYDEDSDDIDNAFIQSTWGVSYCNYFEILIKLAGYTAIVIHYFVVIHYFEYIISNKHYFVLHLFSDSTSTPIHSILHLLFHLSRCLLFFLLVVG